MIVRTGPDRCPAKPGSCQLPGFVLFGAARVRAVRMKQHCRDTFTEHGEDIVKHGEDMPEMHDPVRRHESGRDAAPAR